MKPQFGVRTAVVKVSRLASADSHNQAVVCERFFAQRPHLANLTGGGHDPRLGGTA